MLRITTDVMLRITTEDITVIPSHMETTTFIIRTGERIDVMEGAPAPSGMVRIRWDGYEKGMIGLYARETEIDGKTRPA
jgi:hypothetical protein